jgi:hypothetical protein
MTKPSWGALGLSGLPGSANAAENIVAGYGTAKCQACGFRPHPVCEMSPRGRRPGSCDPRTRA